MLAGVDGTWGLQLVGLVRHLIHRIVRHFTLTNTKVVFWHNFFGLLHAGWYVGLLVDGIAFHLHLRRNVLPLRRVRFRSRRLDVLTFPSRFRRCNDAGLDDWHAHVAAIITTIVGPVGVAGIDLVLGQVIRYHRQGAGAGRAWRAAEVHPRLSGGRYTAAGLAGSHISNGFRTTKMRCVEF